MYNLARLWEPGFRNPGKRLYRYLLFFMKKEELRWLKEPLTLL